MNQNGSDAADFQLVTTDVGAQRVAKVYAEALMNAAEKRGQADGVLEELESLVRDVFTIDARFEQFLSSGVIGRDAKAAAIRTAFEGRASETFTNFLLVLNDHDRLDLLRVILPSYRTLRDERARRVRVRVRSAVPLADDQRERLYNHLRQSFDLEPLIDTEVDPELLGGLVVRVGDWLYDASVRTQLDTIRNKLIAESSYEIQSRRNRFSPPDGD